MNIVCWEFGVLGVVFNYCVCEGYFIYVLKIMCFEFYYIEKEWLICLEVVVLIRVCWQFIKRGFIQEEV